MTILILFIAFLVGVFFVLNKGKKPSETANYSFPKELIQTKGNVPDTSKTLVMAAPEKLPRQKRLLVDYEVFKDHYGENIEDFGHLTPAEAKREMQERKDAGEYIPIDEYFGYMEVIASVHDDERLSKIDDMNPGQCVKWFNDKLSKDIKLSSAVWKALGEKIAPMQEPELFEMLKKVTGGKVEGWVRARKKQGYFFTEKVYDRAREIRTQYVIANEQKQSKKFDS